MNNDKKNVNYCHQTRKMSQPGQDENPAMTKLCRLTLPIIKECCPLSVSTRAIGFMLPEVTRYLAACPDSESRSDEASGVSEYNKIEAPLSAMYRASLAHLEAKVLFAISNQRHVMNPSIYDPSSIFDTQPSSLIYKIVNKLKTRLNNESPVSAIINSIGYMETSGIEYVPKFTKKITPLNLRISNLRKYCEDMANPDTNAEDRKTAYLLNPIPNAKWENEDDLEFVVLKNPDDIIAADYDFDSFLHDERDVRIFLERICAQKKLGFLSTIDWNGHGDPGILASTHVVPGQCLRLDESNENIRSNMELTFWSRAHLSPDSWSMGMLTLAGEVLHPLDTPQRSPIIAAEKHSGEWQSIARVLLL